MLSTNSGSVYLFKLVMVLPLRGASAHPHFVHRSSYIHPGRGPRQHHACSIAIKCRFARTSVVHYTVYRMIPASCTRYNPTLRLYIILLENNKRLWKQIACGRITDSTSFQGMTQHICRATNPTLRDAVLRGVL